MTMPATAGKIEFGPVSLISMPRSPLTSAPGAAVGASATDTVCLELRRVKEGAGVEQLASDFS